MADALLHVADELLFLYLSISGICLFLLAVAGMRRRSGAYPPSPHRYRYAVLVPKDSPQLTLDYPETLFRLFPVDSSPEAMAAQVLALDREEYDGVIILSEAQRVSPDLMERINNAFHIGLKAIQLHHVVEPRRSLGRRLAAIHEEINQFLFREGCTGMGLASALDGCDVVFNLSWLQKNWKKPENNLELRLLNQSVFIEYLSDASVYSTTARTSRFRLTRLIAIRRLPAKIGEGNWSYVGKIIRQFIPSWHALLRISLLAALFFSFYNGNEAVKWWLMVLFLLFTCCLAIPDYLVEKNKKPKKK